MVSDYQFENHGKIAPKGKNKKEEQVKSIPSKNRSLHPTTVPAGLKYLYSLMEITLVLKCF